MSGRASRRKPTTAAELMAQLEADPKFVESAAKDEQARKEREAYLRDPQQPILEDLRHVGIGVDSVWDLVNTSTPYPQALPILVDHLERANYPDRVLEGIGRALAVKPAVELWERLRPLLFDSTRPGRVEGVAIALAACATKMQLDDLLFFVTVEELGERRIYFLSSIAKLGGDRGRELLESLRNDEVLGKEARAILKWGQNAHRH